MPWQEIEIAQKEHRHEIILSGKEVNDRINQSGLDRTLFSLINLNFLKIDSTTLSEVPEDIQNLINLQTLVLHSNKLEKVTDKIILLSKLKVLDLSSNCLKLIPDNLSKLSQLVTINVSNNCLENFPTLSKNSKLSAIDASNNKLTTFPDVCYEEMSNLSEIRCTGNEISGISNTIGTLSALKLLLVNSNKVQTVPAELADCSKLKELNLKDNPISDRRLLKLIGNGHTKQILDYVKLNCERSTVAPKVSKKGKKTSKVEIDENIDKECLYKINVQHCTNDSLKIVIKDEVKGIRPHIIACLILGINFNEDTFKKFLHLQTKLHDTVCNKRNAATIATHDAAKLGGGDLIYTALTPKALLIKPLNQVENVTGAQLFKSLQTKADNLRKEKKRNVYSGVHKYLYLLEGKSHYPCLLNSSGEVISFPPITNAEISKMTIDTKNLLIEITGPNSHAICKIVAETLIKEMTSIFGNLTIQQVKNVDLEGNLKSVYPSRADLTFDDTILVERD
ncbi:hypothetical protein FQA39_LY10027 [Lamprigera yunnana]|nr:hypothetical protein FQA39_LY10027 [Lamprigera yunnana]